MKKSIMLFLLLIGTVCLSLSQESQTLLVKPRIVYQQSPTGVYHYIIPYEEAMIIDMWARKGIESDSTLINVKELMEQIRQSKLIGDSTTILIQRDLYNTRNEASRLGDINIKLQKSEKVCKEENIQLIADNRALKRKIFWIRVKEGATIVVVAIVTYLVIKLNVL